MRRRFSVDFERCDLLMKRLRASRLDNSYNTEMRKLIASTRWSSTTSRSIPSTLSTPPTSTS